MDPFENQVIESWQFEVASGSPHKLEEGAIITDTPSSK